MEALQKDILDSESDDSDYEPPAKANSSSAALSINKKRVREGGLPLDDDDDDDDSDDEFDDDDFSDEADQVEAEAKIGASSSSAGAAAASASADASVTAKPPASVPQHGSEGKAVIRDSQLPNVPAASSGSAAGATEAGKSDGDSQPTKKRKTDEEDEVAGKSSAENKKASAIDELWAEMNAPVKSKAIPNGRGGTAASDASLMRFLNPPTTAVPGSFKVKRLDELEREVQEKEKMEEVQEKKVSEEKKTGLEAVLSAVRGPKREGVLDKTREVWRDFKEKDEQVVQELEMYKKDKNRYTDKVAFLQRSDVRSWEVEQSGKKTRR